MNVELLSRCNDLDDARHDTASRVNMKRKKMWGAAYAMRYMDVPHMDDNEVEFLAELAFLSIFPAYRHITLMTASTALQHASDEYREYFTHLVQLAQRLDRHSMNELATDEDWIAWIESM